MVKFRIKTAAGEFVTLTGSTMPTVTKPMPVVDRHHLKIRWPHLSDRPLKSSGGKLGVLLGLEHGELMIVLESRGGCHAEPYASRTRLGWIIRGIIRGEVKPPQLSMSFACRLYIEGELGPSVNDALERFFETEAFGTEHQVARESKIDCDAG